MWVILCFSHLLSGLQQFPCSHPLNVLPLAPVQLIQNTANCLVFNLHTFTHITSLPSLPPLPVCICLYHIQSPVLTYQPLRGSARPYFQACGSSPPRRTRSSLLKSQVITCSLLFLPSGSQMVSALGSEQQSHSLSAVVGFEVIISRSTSYHPRISDSYSLSTLLLKLVTLKRLSYCVLRSDFINLLYYLHPTFFLHGRSVVIGK